MKIKLILNHYRYVNTYQISYKGKIFVKLELDFESVYKYYLWQLLNENEVYICLSR